MMSKNSLLNSRFGYSHQEDEEHNTDTNQLLEDCRDIPFWNDNHNFNRLIGLPIKEDKNRNKIEHPIYDYELEIFNALENNENVWVKKARGIGATTFLTRYFAWKCLVNDDLKGKQIFFISGTEAGFANELKERVKDLFEERYPEVKIQSKYSEMWLNGVRFKTFPTKALKDMRGYTDVAYIFIDESDYFDIAQQEEIGAVIRSYQEKSNAQIIMVSTPNRPDGLFASIEKDEAFKGFFEKIEILYEKGLDKIFDRDVIAQLKKDNPDFEREYNGKYLGRVGNVFPPDHIELAKIKGQELMLRNPELKARPDMLHVVGIDQPGGGDSPCVIVATEFNEERQIVEILHVQSYGRGWTHAQIADDIFNLFIELGGNDNVKFLVDGARPDFINEVKLRFNERTDWVKSEDVSETENHIIPKNFRTLHKTMLSWTANLLGSGRVALPEGDEDSKEEFSKLEISLRTAWASEWDLDKNQTVNDSHLDALRLALLGVKPEE